MSCVQELQKIERFASADLPQNQAIWTVSKGSLEEITDGHSGNAILFPACLEANEILLRQLNLGRVFDDEHPFLLRNEFSEDRK